MRRIAEQSGLSLQMVSHYFGNREQLIIAFGNRVGKTLESHVQQAISGATAHDRLESVIGFLCSDRYKRIPGNDVIGREIWGLAERDPNIRKIVWGWYEKSLARLSDVIGAAYPAASQRRCRETAYAILCLTEMNEFFSGIGGPRLPAGAAETASFGLLHLLEKRDDAETPLDPV
jgi:AcrR family transcriptional regulator